MQLYVNEPLLKILNSSQEIERAKINNRYFTMAESRAGINKNGFFCKVIGDSTEKDLDFYLKKKKVPCQKDTDLCFQFTFRFIFLEASSFP